MKANLTIILILLLLFTNCKKNKDVFLIDFQINKPFIAQIDSLRNKQLLRKCPNTQKQQNTHNYYYPNFTFKDENHIINYFFNLDATGTDTLKILTVNVNGLMNGGKSSSSGLCFDSRNTITRYDLIKHFNSIYGNYNYADSGKLALNALAQLDFLVPVFTKDYQTLSADRYYHTIDYLFKWELDDYDIEVISASALLINYKTKNFNKTHAEKIEIIRKNYSMNDLVSVRFSAIPYNISNTGKSPFDKKLIVYIDWIIRKGMEEPRTISKLKFDLLILDEFENTIFTLKDCEWDDDIVFENHDFISYYKKSFGFEYISKHPLNKCFNTMENSINKSNFKINVTAIKFKDGIVRK